jgi:hypothetical protein
MLDSRPADEILGYNDHGKPRWMVIDTSALIASVILLETAPWSELLRGSRPCEGWWLQQ